MKQENFLRTCYLRVYNYFTCKQVRRVFFFSLCFALFFLFANMLFPSNILSAGMVLCTATAVGSNALETLQNRRTFLLSIQEYKNQHYTTLIEQYGDSLTVDQAPPPFSESELAWIKQKKREYKYSFIMKLVLICLFAVLLLKMF